MAMRKNVYVDKLNVRKIVDDFGYLILKNVSKMGFPIDDICNAVERSNTLKKKTRLYHLLKGWNGHGSPIKLLCLFS